MSSLQIMLIDDDLQSLDSMGEALALNGYTATTFSDARDALVAYDTKKYDVVVTDYQMRGINGVQVMHTILKENPDAYVIIINGSHNKHYDNAYACFRKPLDFERFMEVLMQIAAGKKKSLIKKGV